MCTRAHVPTHVSGCRRGKRERGPRSAPGPQTQRVLRRGKGAGLAPGPEVSGAAHGAGSVRPEVRPRLGARPGPARQRGAWNPRSPARSCTRHHVTRLSVICFSLCRCLAASPAFVVPIRQFLFLLRILCTGRFRGGGGGGAAFKVISRFVCCCCFGFSPKKLTAISIDLFEFILKFVEFLGL